ncbi:cytochrome P450 76A2-like [Papaver somniferum]|nr:cytochrome P450 76A2-like [Papaver somniferum]
MKVGGTYGATITLGEYGPYWRMLRRLCVAELFSRKRIIDTAPLRRRCVDKLIKWIDDEAKEQSEHGVELARYVFASAFNVMGNIMLSRDLVDPKSSKGNEFFNLTSELTAITGKPNLADFFPVLRWFDPQGLKKHTEEKKNQVLDIVDSFIEGRRRQDIEGKQSRNKEQKDLLDVLMEFEGNGKDEPAKISDRNLNIFILELFIGASETTNSTVEWAMAELLRQPEAMKKVKAEITKVVGFQRNLEESDIKDLHYLDAVIKETLRLHPPLPLLIPRTTIKDMELMGYIIPKDTQIFINVWGLGRDPCSWEDADSFKPERFIDASNLDYRGQNFDYLPFGAGRRICPGIPLGHQMLHLVLGSLIHSFDWSLANGVTPETLDMGERMGTSLRKDIPLKAIPKPLFI